MINAIKNTAIGLSFALAFAASAQKLPAVQRVPVKAPADIKIDGKLSEWGELQAYNKQTGVYYTLANDSRRLYVIICTKDAEITKKLVLGGVTFSIANGNGDPHSEQALSYPYYDRKSDVFFLDLTDAKAIKRNTRSGKSAADSIVAVQNKRISNRLTQLLTHGLNDVPDSVVSVYNDVGIIAASAIDTAFNYIIEIAVPLERFKLRAGQTIAYKLQVNGLASRSNVQYFDRGDRVFVTFTGEDGINYMLSGGQQGAGLAFPTHLNGTYTVQ